MVWSGTVPLSSRPSIRQRDSVLLMFQSIIESMRNQQSIPVVARLLSDIMTGLDVVADVFGRSLTAQVGFEPRSVHVGCVTRKVIFLGEFLFRYFDLCAYSGGRVV